MNRYLGPFRADPVTDAPVLSANAGVRRELPGGKVIRPKMHLYFGTLRIFYGRVAEEMAGRLISFVRDIATRDIDEYVRVRAGAIGTTDGGILMPSPPEPHLPSLVGLLVQGGGSYIGDEMTFVDPILQKLHTTRLPLMIDEEDLVLFPDLEREERSRKRVVPPSEYLHAATPRRPILPDELGGRFADPSPIKWIVFPEFRPGAQTTLEAGGGAEDIFRFSQAVLNLHAWEERTLLMIRDLMDTAAVSRLTVGSIPEAADLIMRSSPDIMRAIP